MLSSGRSMAQVLQHLGVSEQTLHRWRNQYGGLKSEEAKRLKELQVENARLKRLAAEKELPRRHQRFPGSACGARTAGGPRGVAMGLGDPPGIQGPCLRQDRPRMLDPGRTPDDHEHPDRRPLHPEPGSTGEPRLFRGPLLLAQSWCLHRRKRVDRRWMRSGQQVRRSRGRPHRRWCNHRHGIHRAQPC